MYDNNQTQYKPITYEPQLMMTAPKKEKKPSLLMEMYNILKAGIYFR